MYIKTKGIMVMRLSFLIFFCILLLSVIQSEAQEILESNNAFEAALLQAKKYDRLERKIEHEKNDEIAIKFYQEALESRPDDKNNIILDLRIGNLMIFSDEDLPNQKRGLEVFDDIDMSQTRALIKKWIGTHKINSSAETILYAQKIAKAFPGKPLETEALKIVDQKLEEQQKVDFENTTHSEESIEVKVEPDDYKLQLKAIVPVSELHEQRQKNISEESLQQLIEGLANFDDMHFATTSDGVSVCAIGSSNAAVQLIDNLFRVRKLWTINEISPGSILPLMRTSYTTALEEWPAAYQIKIEDVKNGVSSYYAPPPVDRVETKAVVAAYFLGESGEIGSLELLYTGYKKGLKWIDEYDYFGRGQSPVPLTFSLYAMHRLVSTIDMNEVGSEEAKALSAAYLTWADNHIPPPDIKEVVAWNADYFEGDSLRQVVDPGGVLLEDQPKIEMVSYPLFFRDKSYFDAIGLGRDLSDQCKEWQERLSSLVEAILEE